MKTKSSPTLTAVSPAPQAWGAEVIADDSGKYCGNGLRFATRDEAEAYARELFSRWTLVREWRAVPVSGAVNYRFVDGAARPI